jgi:uncharacterized protein (DUF1697 family)
MTVFAALLRAVNVGGTGKLAMIRLRAVCAEVGFHRAATYIQSGNVLFESDLKPAAVKAKLETALTVEMGKPCGAVVRTAKELASVVRRNPFKDAVPSQVLVVFFVDAVPSAAAVAAVKIPGREELKLDGRELFIHFPDGMGRSKLRVPFASSSTGRNVNTVVKLAAMADAMEASP